MTTTKQGTGRRRICAVCSNRGDGKKGLKGNEWELVSEVCPQRKNRAGNGVDFDMRNGSIAARSEVPGVLLEPQHLRLEFDFVTEL